MLGAVVAHDAGSHTPTALGLQLVGDRRGLSLVWMGLRTTTGMPSGTGFMAGNPGYSRFCLLQMASRSSPVAVRARKWRVSVPISAVTVHPELQHLTAKRMGATIYETHPSHVALGTQCGREIQ